MNERFRFVPGERAGEGEYYLGDRRLIRVSEALKAGGLVDYAHIQPDVLERAAQRGRAVHSATHFLDDNDLDVESISDEVAPYLEAWRKFKADTKATIIRREESGFNEAHGYAGTPDLVAKLCELWWLIDLKTYAPNEATGVQLSAYARLDFMPDGVTMNRAGLWLKPNGKYSLTLFTDSADWQRFLICLDKAKRAQEE
jgi:hypothetical protein